MAITSRTARSRATLFCSLLLSGCANQLTTLTPATSFLTSEVQGELLQTTISMGASEGASLHATIKEETEELDFSAGKSFSHFFLMPQTGLSKRVDVFVKASTHSPFMYGLKWQVLGETKKETRRGDESFSIYMSGGRSRYSAPSDLNLGGSGDFSANRTHTQIDFGAMYGKRIYSDILLYGRISRIVQDVHGDIDYEDNENLDEAELDLSGEHTSYALGIVWYTKDINLGFELARLQTDWEEAPNVATNSLLLSVSKDI